MRSAFGAIWIHCLLLVAMIGLSVGAFAQGGSGELTGLVTDSTGAVVAGVEVKLTDGATGEVRTTVTTPAGTYRFPALPVAGTYSLEVTTKGFKSVKVQNVVISVGSVTTRDIKLDVGTNTEQVTVEAGSQLVQTEDSSLSQDVDRHVWLDMPLENRSQNEFMALLPGAEPANNANLVSDRGAAVNGTRSGSGNYMVEGFDNNDQGQGGGASAGIGGAPGGALTTISPDAIEEYRVISGTPPAEYGKAGGFVTDTVLKGGTNTWHGSLFEYNRIQALAANSWFSNNAGIQDSLVRNQFGGSIGGPIIKDKTFFYFTAEAHRLRTASPVTNTTISQDFVDFVQSGAFETFMESDPGGICEQYFGHTCLGVFAGNATTGPIYQKMYAAQPIPFCVTGAANCTNLTATAQGLWTGHGNGPTIQYPVNIYGTLTVSPAQVLNQMRYSTKVDHRVGARDQINATYLYDNADTTIPLEGQVANAEGIPYFGPTFYNHSRAQNAGVTWSHTLSSAILNQARLAYTRHTGNFPGDPNVAGMPSILNFFDSPDVGFGNNTNLPQFFTENEFSYRDDLSVTKGKHNFKGGAEYRRTRNGSSFDSYKFGYNVVDDTEDLLTDATFTNNWEAYAYTQTPLSGHPLPGPFGSIGEAAGALNPSTGGLPIFYRGYRANEVAMYVQDDWRVHPRLTVNLGVRWEYFGPPHNFQNGIDANFFTGVDTTPFANPCVPPPAGTCPNIPNPFMPVNSPYYAGFATGAVQQRDHSIWNKDLNNFGPRIGFAYDTLGNQKLVLRGGFGINYDRIYNNVFENIRFNPPNYAIGLLGTFGNQVLITPDQTTALWTYPFTGTSTFFGNGLTPSIRAMDQNLVTPYYEQAHLGFQYQLGKNFVLESNYVGTFGHKLIGIIGRNNYDGLTAAGYDESFLNPNYSNISFRTNCCDSNYHGWQTTLRKRFSGGLEFNANYTYSKAMDDISDAFTTKNAGGAAYPTDSENVHFDYGPADYNVKHRVVTSFVYDLPFAKSNRWVGGWNVSGIVSWQTGANFNIINSTVDSNADGQFNDRAVYLGPGRLTNDINHHVSPATGYLTADNPDGSNNAWGALNGPHSTDPLCPASVNMGLWCQGTALGQIQRNSIFGPAFFNTDLGAKKSFRISEKASLRFEANFFNIFNHPNFLIPDGNLNDITTFGKSTSTFTNEQTGGPRITQLALRFDF
jgi:hypothetical protein